MPDRITLEVTPEQKKRFDWLIAHEEEVEAAVQDSRTWRSLGTLGRWLGGIAIVIFSATGAIVGILMLRNGR